MIYLISKQSQLFSPEEYQVISCEEALEILEPLKRVQFDTETLGLDAHTKALLTVQLGNKQNQCVFDWTTLTSEEKLKIKAYFESERVFIGWNLQFDLCFLYVQNIWPKHILDGMIVEKLLYLGYAVGHHEYSLKAAAMHYLNYDLDKTARGKIITQGLTVEVIVYAAGDVMWLEDILAEQWKKVKEENLEKAVKFECEAVKSVAYFKHCGVKLDAEKWKAKMVKDQAKLNSAIQALNQWVVQYDGKTDSIKVSPNDFSNGFEFDDYCEDLVNKGYTFNPETRTFEKSGVRRYSKVNLQGDLFTGFDAEPHCTINWSSQKQVLPLFEELGIHVTTFDKKTKQKKKSLEANVLKPQKNEFPIIPLFLKYQEAAKVVSTYGQNWLDAINPVTGRLHLELHSIGTDTCRLSSGGGVYKLNLQNLPHDAETRACFVAESGNKWLSCDYAG